MTSSPSLGEGPRAGPLRLVLCTFPDRASATRVSRALVDRGVVACATALPAWSTFRWKGKREEVEEVLVLYKTSTKKVGALFREVLKRHPYKVPELVELETQRVHEPYLLWALSRVDREPGRVARAAGATPVPRRRATRRAR